jgi:hypothetical protein
MNLCKPALFTAAAVVCIGLAASSCTSRRPMNAPWCFANAETSNMYCEYETLRQCEATLSGLGGVCVQNPRYDAPPVSRRR